MKFFPTCLIILDICAAITYATGGLDEWRKVIYWMAAAALTYVVTY